MPASRSRDREGPVLDLCIVGAGPAGLACSLEARQSGLRFVALERETELGGTVAKYPRRKLVMTQPVDMPIYGRFRRDSYSKEDLIAMWTRVAKQQRLPILHGQTLRSLERDPSEPQS